MLGKRCRTLQRTASISQNMGPHYLHLNNYHQYHDLAANPAKANAENMLSFAPPSANPHAPAIIPQIIGFNPIIKHDHSPQSKAFHPPDHATAAQNTSSRPLPHDMYDDDPGCAHAHLQHKLVAGNITTAPAPSKRSQFIPRSALQTLLAAARQITCTDQSSTLTKNEASKSPSIKTSAASPSCATSISAKQGLWQGFTISESKSKEISANQNSFKTALITTAAKAGPECYNVNMGGAESDQNIFHVEGTSSNLAQDRHISLESQQYQHALYLATSPLSADLIPNLASSMSFMESCYLCKRPLGQGCDIFMYSKGESAFCSMECRDKQMRLEERKEKSRPMHLKIHNINMQTQDFNNNPNIACSNGAPHHQHRKPHHHHHDYSSPAYNNKHHLTSLLMPTA